MRKRHSRHAARLTAGVAMGDTRKQLAEDEMDDSRLYHEGFRELQDRFDMRRIADRLERVDLHMRSQRQSAS